MTATYTNAPLSRPGPFARAENWLDEKGKGAWIALMVLGFIFVWPAGLALLIYMVWSKRLFSRSGRTHTRTGSCSTVFSTMKSSGNAAFDSYKADTLRRLEDEQRAFEEFLQRLREAKDKAEFDQFIDSRGREMTVSPDADEPTPAS